MKLYIISGLGADYKVLEHLTFNENIKVHFIKWLMPEKNEDFSHYVGRMAEPIDASEPFYLLGYSFGGIIAQEIHKIKRAQKIVILGSIKSHREKSGIIKFGHKTSFPRYLPPFLFDSKSKLVYGFIRKFVDSNSSKIMEYFRVDDPYYLKWSLEKIADWQFDEQEDVIQILAEKDIVFPPKYSKPNYIVKKGTHLFPATKPKEVSKILNEIFI